MVTILEADRSPAGLPPLPAHQVTMSIEGFADMQESENCIACPQEPSLFKDYS